MGRPRAGAGPMSRAAPRIPRELVKWTRRPDTRKKRWHLDFVRSLRICIACGRGGPVHAAHVRLNSAEYNTFNTKGRKPDDKFALPVCASCHLGDQHSVEGEPQFWARLGIDPLDAALQLYRISGNYDAAMRTIERARQSIALHAAALAGSGQ